MALQNFEIFAKSEIAIKGKECDLADDIINIIASKGDINEYEQKVKELKAVENEMELDNNHLLLYIFDTALMYCDDVRYYDVFKKAYGVTAFKGMMKNQLSDISYVNIPFYAKMLLRGNAAAEKMLADAALAQISKKKEKKVSTGWSWSDNDWISENSEYLNSRHLKDLNYVLIKSGNGELVRKCAGCFKAEDAKKSDIYLYFAAKQKNVDVMQALFDIGLRFSADSQSFVTLAARHSECITDFLLPNFGKYMLKRYDAKKDYTISEFLTQFFAETDEKILFKVLCCSYAYLEEKEYKEIVKYLPKIRYIDTCIKYIAGMSGAIFGGDEEFKTLCSKCLSESEITLKLYSVMDLRCDFVENYIKNISAKVKLDISEFRDFNVLAMSDMQNLINNFDLTARNDRIDMLLCDIINRDNKVLIFKAQRKQLINKENYMELISYATISKKLKSLSVLASLVGDMLDKQ
ncbi:MAG: hypothetical protein J6C82_07650 [Clostridia bacterium]|nr:hypothetical protein [Clostridia bacterium]